MQLAPLTRYTIQGICYIIHIFDNYYYIMQITDKQSVKLFICYFWCAVHTYNLEGASPLWRSVVANH
jgi:hypothetical protein